MRPLSVGFLLLIGCAPPEPPDIQQTADPAIRIAYPPRDVGTVSLLPNGGLSMLIVVDVDNIELTSPYVEGIQEVEGQGHWHATLGVVEGYQASFDNALEFTLEPAQVNPGITRLTVSLQSNLHADLEEFAEWESNIEFELVEYEEPADTGTTDTGP